MRLLEHEQVLIRTRAHPRSLVPAAATVVLTAACLAFAIGLLERADLATWLVPFVGVLKAAVWALALMAVGLGTVRPLLRWARRTFVLTSDRLLQCAALGGEQRQMPLHCLAHHTHRRRGGEAGDLSVTFRDHYRMVEWRLRDVPEVGRFDEVLGEVARAARARRGHTAAGPAGRGWGG